MKIVQVVSIGQGVLHIGDHPDAHPGGTIVLADDGNLYRLDAAEESPSLSPWGWTHLPMPDLPCDRKAKS